jgi:hypothetical protein
MLNVLKDGPFRYIHSAATGELIITLFQIGSGRFTEYDNGEIARSLREWKAIARRRMDHELITDNIR